MTRTGTNHFTSLVQAGRHYTGEGHFAGASNSEIRREMVRKMDEKEIVIGKPVVFQDEKLVCVDGRYHIESPETYRMGIRVHLADGNSILTEINGTHRSVSNYYLGKYFEGSIAERIEFLS